jgi:hypothetical protein
MFVPESSTTDWIIAGGSILTLFSIGAVYGSLKSDNKHVKEALKEKRDLQDIALKAHEQHDNERFGAIGLTLDNLDEKVGEVHTAVTRLVTRDEMREQGKIHTRAEDNRP